MKSIKVWERCDRLEKYREDEERFVPENERAAKPSPELEKGGSRHSEYVIGSGRRPYCWVSRRMTEFSDEGAGQNFGNTIGSCRAFSLRMSSFMMTSPRLILSHASGIVPLLWKKNFMVL